MERVMESCWMAILGALQGATEFLPVSSSGHLALGQMVMERQGLTPPVPASSLTLEVLLHLATLLAVLIYFRHDAKEAVLGFVRLVTSRLSKGAGPAKCIGPKEGPDRGARMALAIIVGTIPTGILGVALRGVALHVASHAQLLGAIYLVLAILLTFSLLIRQRGEALDWKKALIIGVVQGLAVLPGISRSGVTIIAGLALGLSRDDAVKFSFLLSVPAILGAAVLELKIDEMTTGGQSFGYIVGALTAFVVGLLSLSVLTRLVRRGRLWTFAPYVAGIGVFSLVFL